MVRVCVRRGIQKIICENAPFVPHHTHMVGVGFFLRPTHRVMHSAHVDDVGQVATGPKCHLAVPAIAVAVVVPLPDGSS